MSQKPSLLIIGNSNVGKSSITRLLMPNPRRFKGKIGKTPGSTLLIKSVTQENLPYNIVDLPGFGYVSQSSRRRGEHIKKQIVIHIEKYFADYFFGLIVLNILRIEDEIRKYFIQNKRTIPLSFELIQFLKEFEIPSIILINKIDKVSNIDQKRIIELFIKKAKEFDLQLIHLNDYKSREESVIPYMEFSALKKINLGKLKAIIREYLNLKD
jgi:GTP-binding protein EngB required for normal cell division